MWLTTLKRASCGAVDITFYIPPSLLEVYTAEIYEVNGGLFLHIVSSNCHILL